MFTANTKNQKTLICDEIYMVTDPVVNKVLTCTDAYGKAEWCDASASSSSVEVSTQNYLNGVTQTEIQNGVTWLNANSKDESTALLSLLNNTNSELTNLGIDANAIVTIKLESKKGYFYFNNSISVPQNRNLMFLSPVVYGNNFRINLAGQIEENPSNLLLAPYVTQSYAKGSTSIIVNANGNNLSTWAVGDIIALRSISLDKREDHKIASITNNGNNTFTITLNETLDDFAMVQGDPVRKFYQTTLAQATTRKDTTLNVNSTSFFEVGKYVYICNFDNSGDYNGIYATNSSGSYWRYSNNKYMVEIKQICDIDATNKILFLDSPLSNSFPTTNVYIMQLKPRMNVHIDGLMGMMIEQPTYPRNNYHMVTLDTAVNCSLKNITFTDNFYPFKNASIAMYPNINNIIRVDTCYMCDIQDIYISKYQNEYTDSGAGYGVTCYFSSYCHFERMHLNTLRHNVLLQGCTSCTFTDIEVRNVLGSGIDLHGLNERDNIFNNVFCEASQYQYSVGSNNNTDVVISQCGLVRLGNTTHSTGTEGNKFMNFTIRNGRSASNISTWYGIDLIARCINNTFKDITIENVDVGIHASDYIWDRLDTRMLTASNTFENILVKDTTQAIKFDGEENRNSASYNYITGNATNTGSNWIQLNGTSSIHNYNSVFNNWNLLINSSNYAVSNYVATSKTLYTYSNMSASSNDAYQLRDSLTTSISPIRDIAMINCKFMNNSNLVYIRDVEKIKFVDCFFEGNDSNTPYVCDMSNVTNLTFARNISKDVNQYIRSYASSNVDILHNTLINHVNSNVFTDGGSNSNVSWRMNRMHGFSNYYSITNSTFKKELERYGFSNNPSNPALTIDDTDGSVNVAGGLTANYIYANTYSNISWDSITNIPAGIGASNPTYFKLNGNTIYTNSNLGVGLSNPTQKFQVYGSSTFPMLLQSTGTSCEIGLMDSNTSSNSSVRIKAQGNSLAFRASSVDTMTLSNSKVGIMNTAPAYALHVTGQICASSNIYENGTTLSNTYGLKSVSDFASNTAVWSSNNIGAGAWSSNTSSNWFNKYGDQPLCLTGDMIFANYGAGVIPARIRQNQGLWIGGQDSNYPCQVESNISLLVGYKADSNSSPWGYGKIFCSNAVSIGTTTSSYSLHLGSDSAAKPSTNTWTITSDERLKYNISLADLDVCYSNIKQIPLKRYTWRDDVYTPEQVSDRSKVGWIAQDVEKIFPKAVDTKDLYGLSNCKTLNSDQIIATLYGAVQKMQSIIEEHSAILENVKIVPQAKK
jgi:hypothetical protein